MLSSIWPLSVVSDNTELFTFFGSSLFKLFYTDRYYLLNKNILLYLMLAMCVMYYFYAYYI